MSPVASEALKSALARQVVICVGSGGVGKTTTSAALALQAAAMGKKVLVCTIDPARRLANSMGLASLTNAETRVPDEALASTGARISGQLFAMMLDLKRSWDEVIERYAPNPQARDTILANRFYRQLSTALAGSQEYVAMEKLHALHERGAYDLIVLDTPPTTNALDFLDAPNRVIDFLDADAMKWFTSGAFAGAGRVGLRVFQAGSAYAGRILARFTGAGTLEELSKFMGSLSGMYEGFKERAGQVRQLLASERTSFVVVTSPSPLPMEEALHFHRQLTLAKMRVTAVVANRVNVDFLRGAPLHREALAAAAKEIRAPGVQGLGPLGERLADTLADEQVLASLDAKQLERLAAQVAPTPVLAVPRFDHDVHDLNGLWQIDRTLFGS
ncbi:MAG: ArsA family ATPase [Deltaproteobacteria bacterium]|nr:ArsA family ATPase [Deltaproteobacteria bacterium]